MESSYYSRYKIKYQKPAPFHHIPREMLVTSVLVIAQSGSRLGEGGGTSKTAFTPGQHVARTGNMLPSTYMLTDDNMLPGNKLLV